MYAEFAFCNHIGNASDSAIDLPEPASDKKLIMSELEVSDIVYACTLYLNCKTTQR